MPDTIWGVESETRVGYLGILARPVFSCDGRRYFFLLLVSRLRSKPYSKPSAIRTFGSAGGIVIAVTVYLVFDFAVVVLLFAMILSFYPDVKISGEMFGPVH